VVYQGFSSVDHPYAVESILALDAYQFYEKPLPLTPNEAARLTALCCDPENFNFNSECWFCEFHEDYGVEWRSGQRPVQLVFCFTCDEVVGLQQGGWFQMAMKSPQVFRALFPPHSARRAGRSLPSS
jgi:hypothetical protein